ncbi:MAG: hypothetical protein ACTSU2_01640 [Promethearchaeota archaeon]
MDEKPPINENAELIEEQTSFEEILNEEVLATEILPNGKKKTKFKMRIPERIEEEELWDEVGLHKTLGGNFFRNFVFMALSTIISIVTFTFVLQYLIPYPTSKGYYDVSQGLFAFIFSLFDVGTAYGIERFIAEYYVKDKIRMMQYIQFYIWYQAFTGLIQVTFISWWILYELPKGNLAYLAWVLLFINVKQYPGMLGTFRSVLRGFQRYDKTIILDFIDSEGFQFITQIIFFIGGRYYGATHPAIGELMGLSIGMVLGYYIDDFFNMWLSMHFFKKIVSKFGFTAKNAWEHDFGWDIFKECMKYGLGISWAPLISIGIGYIQLRMSLSIVPGYTTWIVLANLGKGIGGAINMGDINITSPISESLNNDKFELSNFYVSQAFKYWAFIFFAMGGIIAVLIPIIPKVLLIIPGVAEQYEPALIFIIPGMIAIIWDVPITQFTRILTAKGKVNLKSATELSANIITLVLWYLALYKWQIWTWGNPGIIFLFVLIGFPARTMIFLVYLWYINKNIIKIRISWWQTFGASILTFICVLIIGYLYIILSFIPMLDYLTTQTSLGVITGTIIAALIGVCIILFGFMLVIFPFLYALFGGWDVYGLETLRKSYLLSGPSKIFIKSIYVLSVKGSNLSPWFNKFKIPFEKAFKEAEELFKTKKANEQEVLEKLNKEKNTK